MSEHTSISTDRECAVCNQLRALFTGYVNADLGSFDDVLKQPCSGHDALLRYIRKDLDDKRKLEPQDATPAIPGELKMLLTSTAKDYYCINVIEFPNPRFYYWSLLRARSAGEPQTPGYGRILHPDWIDVELIKSWKIACLEQHGEKCRSPLKIPNISPVWLIDTVNHCLVPGNGISDYVALSYRWGSSAGFRTGTQILDKTQDPGFFLQPSIASTIPLSVKNAMGLVSAIDERYLWVDALCIVQDDIAHIEKELQRMGAIYASAKLTIVAADGDAADGLPGLEGISAPRALDQVALPLFEDEKVIIRDQEWRPAALAYFARGWTYQELYLSKRRLTFANKQAIWNCSCEEWHEDLIPPDSGKTVNHWLHSLRYPKILSGIPAFDELDKVLSAYNMRDLTYAEDALPGVTGLLTVLSRSFEGGFLFGLPEVCFDAALMWQTWFNEGLRRREHSGRASSLLSGAFLPSWSWVGWQFRALVLLESEDALEWPPRKTRRMPWRKTQTKTTPLTRWYTHDSPQSETRRLIKSAWFERLEKIRDPEYPLPEHWNKEKYDPSRHGPGQNQEDLAGKDVYWHSSLPGKYFQCPIPITDVDEKAESFIPPQTQYISCETKRGWFAAARFPKSDFEEHETAYDHHLLALKLVNRQGQYCGQLDLHCSADGLSFPDDGSLSVELAAICLQSRLVSDIPEGEENSALPSHEVFRQPSKPKIMSLCYADFYAVLWIEWINGVAYRKASGFVKKRYWEEHGVEDVHLVLG